MTEQDYLFYTYTGTWDTNTLPFTRNYPYSLVLHPETQRLMCNGVVYGNGSESGPYFIKGTNNSSDTTGKWVGSNKSIESYKEGLSIIFVPNVNGDSIQTTLNINNLGERNCYFTDTNPLTTQYSIGTPILFTFIGDADTGCWKRADMDTTKTPVQMAVSGNYFYFNLTKVTSGLTDIYTIGSNVRYDFSTQTMYCPDFNGHFTGDVTGNAGSANKLKNSRTLWSQSFDGTSDVQGDILNTGNIRPSTDGTSNIGGALYYYYQVFGKFFRGRADAVMATSFSTSNPYKTIYLLGQQSGEFGTTDSNTGKVNVNTRVYITEDSLLHSPYMRCGNSTAFNANYVFFASGQSKLDGNVWCTNNVTIDGKLGVGTSNPAYKMHIVGNGYLTSDLYANSFVKHGGTIQQVLLANGSVKFWETTESVNTIVARDSNCDIYTHQYFTSISNENIQDIGSVYVTNSSSDNAIRKVSFESFMEQVGGGKIITLTKNLKVTANWMDTGITTDLTTFPKGNGTYVVQIDATAINNSTDKYPSIYSGIMTIYNGTNNTTESEEVILHRAGHSTSKRLYLRTMPTASSTGYCKLQIASSSDFNQAYNLIFQFKKII